MLRTFLMRFLLVLTAVAAPNLQPVLASSLVDSAADADADALTEALVRHRLAADDLASFHRIEVQVSDGVVSLRGTARTRQSRDAIVREVGKISGVVSVLDKIEVEPTP